MSGIHIDAYIFVYMCLAMIQNRFWIIARPHVDKDISINMYTTHTTSPTMHTTSLTCIQPLMF
jgi:hypothetical protein